MLDAIKIVNISVHPPGGFQIIHREGSLDHAHLSFGLGSNVDEEERTGLFRGVGCDGLIPVVAIVLLVFHLVDRPPSIN